MHPEQSALLRTICEEPGDDTPRLVYADWLEEHGQSERAEYIRTQIEMARLVDEANGRPEWFPDIEQRRSVLSQRCTQILNVYEDNWRGEWREIPGVYRRYFHRGFRDHVELDDADILRHPERLFHTHPVDSLTFSRISPRFVQHVVDCPQLAYVRSLRIPRLANERVIASILESPHLHNLETLDLSSTDVGDHVMKTIATQPHLSKLQHIKLSANRIGPAGLAAFAESRIFSDVRSLSLFRNPLEDDGVIALASAPHLQELISLELQNTQFGNKGVIALTQSTVWANGMVLNLCYNQIEEIGANALAECPHLSKHRLIVLRSNRINDKAAFALAGSPHLKDVPSLELGSNMITPEGKRMLVERFGNRVHV